MDSEVTTTLVERPASGRQTILQAAAAEAHDMMVDATRTWRTKLQSDDHHQYNN